MSAKRSPSGRSLPTDVRRVSMPAIIGPPLPPDTDAPPRPRGGAPRKYQWHYINAEIARRCHDPKTGRVKIPKSERKLAKDVLAWCQTTYDEEPAESVMREAVKAM